MMEHSTAFQHDLFLDCAQKVRNSELYYKAIAFYLEQQPMSLVRLLQVLTPNLDHSRVVHQLRKLENLPLVLPYLKSVQKENLSAVNEAVNELYIEDEDYESLHQSIDDYDNFDQIALAQKIEKHELLEFRRIAAYLYKKNKRWQQSVSLSKADKMYKDAIETTFSSGDPELAEELLRFFVSVQDRECFCATLYTTYTLVKPDVAIELAWRNGYQDFVMPYVIQYTRHLHERLAELEKRTAPKEEAEAAEDAANAAMQGMMYQETLAITNGGYGMDPAYGMQPGMPQPGMPGMPGMPPMPPQGMPGSYPMPPQGMPGMY